MPDPSERPVVAVVVPLFAHSVLIADALRSAIFQVSRYPYVIVVVNDGCRYAESDAVVKSIVALHRDRIRYIVQPNSGLSAARNTGIEYALSRFPTSQAVYFLDADNSIQPKTIENVYAELLEHPEASWIYPNIDMFGIKRNFDYGGAYSLLKHTKYNICEAGSMVHRRVFDAGVRFDEKMKLGFEDWDFWLSAARLGFTGRHYRQFGFRYRNRGESMLSQSKRDNTEITAYMQSKHRSILGRRSLQRLEASTAPRYAFMFTDTGEILISSGHPNSGKTLAAADFEELIWRNLVIPNWQAIPPFLAFTTRAVFDGLSRAGLTPWIVHEYERALRDVDFACVTINHAAGSTITSSFGGSVRDCSILAIGREVLCSIMKDPGTTWVENILFPESDMKVALKKVTVPPDTLPVPAKSSIVFGFLVRMMAWRSSNYQDAAKHAWIWRTETIPPPHTVHKIVREAFAGEVFYPAAAEGRQVGFVLPIGSFGGVERVAYNLAREFSKAGWHVHLFLVGCNRLELPQEFQGVADSINFIEGDEFLIWDDQSKYQGTAIPAIATQSPQAVDRLVAALSWLDAVVNCQSGSLNAAAAPLRKLGVKTITHVHLLDHSPLGRSVGHAMIALAYEHAFDLIACTSAQLTNWMHAAGIPREKLLHVRNAPGYSLGPTSQADVLQRRRRKKTGGLNVLYLGRLDRQKGIDRLAALIDRTRELGLPVNWRIVGGAVAGDYAVAAGMNQFIEPPVFDRESLSELHDWADVLVLLSDFEGVPLSVLEAQRAGVVVIATNVGGLPEIVESGVTGFLVDVGAAVEQSIEIMTQLIQSPDARIAIAEAASVIADWPDTAKELIERVRSMVDSTSGEPPALTSIEQPYRIVS
jgi:glycosyltransferase involved in cell wall biosynthesis